MILHRLEALAHECLANHWPLYLLLDPLAGCATDDALHPDHLREQLGSQALTPVPRPDLAHALLSCPLLVRLAAAGESAPQPLLERSARSGEQDEPGFRRYVCGWLSSTEPAEAIGRHLIELGRLAGAPQGRFCPIHEPLRLELLAACHQAGGPVPWWPVRRWLYPASHGEPCVLSTDQAQPLMLDARASSTLAEAPLIARIMRLWWHRCGALPPTATPDVLRQVQQARQLKLYEPRDIITLALHQLAVHPDLHRHSLIRDFIAQAGAGRRSLAAAFDSMTQDAWDDVLWHHHHGVAR
ncbi:hypothetical protein SFA35_10595 [Pseudomonas sp. HR96]|uniref:hypothetical protein n=1 Tax=Pseudomonas sp. HR96 TaxID=1027966 RepID=UPI002A75539B|nr:hypothetical protein [Pseudomonas sp. HR96]WPP01761.1 hypothetical protein SFA35_10595 [Pseudomonas sp. HR96]